MATHDYSIANQSFPATRSDLNNALTAIKSSNSASAAPTASLVPGQLFYDTANNVLKVYTGSVFDAVVSGSNSVTADILNIAGNGTSGQILTSDADGSFSWATLTAGSGLDLSGSTFSIETDLRDGITHIGRDANDYINIATTTQSFFLDGGERARIVNNGDFHADGDVIAYSTTISDERLKTGISTVSNALEKVSQLNGVEFTRKSNGQRSAGVIAQQVEKVLPQAVKEKALPLQTGDEDTLYKTVEYDALHALYIEAIKELKDMVEKQAIQIKDLQGA
jgi:hypothetical protein